MDRPGPRSLARPAQALRAAIPLRPKGRAANEASRARSTSIPSSSAARSASCRGARR